MQSLKCETRVTTFLRPNSRYKRIIFNHDFNVKKIAVINSVQIAECLILAHTYIPREVPDKDHYVIINFTTAMGDGAIYWIV